MPKRNPILKIEIKNNDVNLSCFDFPKIADLLTEIQKEGTDDQKIFNKIFLGSTNIKIGFRRKKRFYKIFKIYINYANHRNYYRSHYWLFYGQRCSKSWNERLVLGALNFRSPNRIFTHLFDG